MQWRGRKQSSNIEDRRGSGGGFSRGRRGGGLRLPVKAGGGGLVTMIVIGAIAWFVFGINPIALFAGGDMGGQGSYQTSQTGSSGGGVQSTPGETDDFIATVLADTENVWSSRFEEAGQSYPEPTLVLFDNRVESACGRAGASTGPFYCPSDQKLYIDLSFFEQLEGQLNAPGDFAQAYVVAHEVGHHIQNLTGVLQQLNEARRTLPEDQSNALSVRVELQADCYAGIWAHDTRAAGYVEPGDIDEALNAAFQIGDDTLQKRSQGTVVPDSFTHGSSAQRQEWFRRGYQEGNFGACDTLDGQL